MDFPRHIYIETVPIDNMFPNVAKINLGCLSVTFKGILNKSAHPWKCWNLKLSNTGTYRHTQETNEIQNLRQRQKQEDMSQTEPEVGQGVRMGQKPLQITYFCYLLKVANKDENPGSF